MQRPSPPAGPLTLFVLRTGRWSRQSARRSGSLVTHFMGGPSHHRPGTARFGRKQRVFARPRAPTPRFAARRPGRSHGRCGHGTAARCSRRSPAPRTHAAGGGAAPGTASACIARGDLRKRTGRRPSSRRRGARVPESHASPPGTAERTRGDCVAAIIFLRTSTAVAISARSTTFDTSPPGISRASMSCRNRRASCASCPTVTSSRNRAGATGLTGGR